VDRQSEHFAGQILTPYKKIRFMTTYWVTVRLTGIRVHIFSSSTP